MAQQAKANSGPGYAEHPGHRVEVEPCPKRVKVLFGGETVADSRKALRLEEKGHAAVHYFPREDVRWDLLERTTRKTFCPFKGEASYWTLRVGGRVAENAVWSYQAPFDEVSNIRDHMAFYGDRVDGILVQDEPGRLLEP